MIDNRLLEKPFDLPQDFTHTASNAAVELDQLRSGVRDKRENIRDLVDLLQELQDKALYGSYRHLEGTALAAITGETESVHNAVKILQDLIWEIDKANHLFLPSEEYERLSRVCLTMSKATSIFRLVTKRY